MSQATGLVASVLTALVINFKVDPGVYGAVAVVVAKWGVLATTTTWCGGVVLRYGPRELATSGTLGVTVATRLLFALPVLPVVMLGIPVYFGVLRGWSLVFVASSVAFVVLATLHDVLQYSAYAAQRFRMLTLTSALTRGAPLGAIAVYTTAGLAVTAATLLGAMVVGYAIAVSVLFVGLLRLLPMARPDRALLREMWRYSIPNLVGAPAAMAISAVDLLVLDWCASRADVGRYQLAYGAVTVFAALGASVTTVFTPELVTAKTRGDDGALGRFLTRDQPALATFLGLGATGLACVAPVALRLILSDRFAAAGDLVALLTVAGCFIVGFYSLSPIAMSLNQIWSIQIAYGVQAAINIGLDLLLGPKMGAVGIAAANVVAWCVSFVLLAVLLRRKVDVSLRPVLPLVAASAVVTALLLAHVAVLARLGLGAALLTTAAWGIVRHWRSRAGSTTREQPS